MYIELIITLLMSFAMMVGMVVLLRPRSKPRVVVQREITSSRNSYGRHWGNEF